MAMRLAGKRVLITGTAGGQGEAAQAMFAREGARVVGCDVQEGGAERTAAAARQEGYDVTGHTVDLSDADAAREWVEEAVDGLGGIDVLYNNASGWGFAPFSEMTIELWRHVMRVELDIVFHTTQPAWRHLVAAGGGSIINTASMSAIRGIGPLGQAAHAAAKGGVIGLTKTLAAEGASDGIRANTISPGFVQSPATDAAVTDEFREFMIGMHLIRRAGVGDDIAALAVFLASDESSWVTGQNFSVDGGATAGWR
ncbi:SDR family oxidoreductase [Actinoallomurus spadix]|uniref:3-oxoacyl-ACP reductase FabG n=1 Tax=Actinoallomurus spadix TaxID=79912 RepID=A0ABN0XI36_9ACTN|nr:SDR family NAD(P)-dependent oxidoreductase [Actinoallomurus spadix]MCO5987603.1 SDR family oxidoreductase [Actinoallomurus spadix]